MTKIRMAILAAPIFTMTTVSIVAIGAKLSPEPAPEALFGHATQNTFLKCALAHSRDFQTPQEPDFNFDIQAREGDGTWIVGDWTAGPLQIHRVGDSASFIAKLPNGGVATVSITPHVVVGAFKAVASRHRVHITPERRTPQLVIVQL